jgi:hypothetical protein
MLQAVGLTGLAPEVVVLGLYVVGCFGLAMRLFRWQ